MKKIRITIKNELPEKRPNIFYIYVGYLLIFQTSKEKITPKEYNANFIII